MQTRTCRLFVFSAVALGACRPTGCSSTDTPERSPAPAARSGLVGGPVASAVALCTALHAEPARRRAECCGGQSSPLFHDECVRHLSASLRSGSVRLDSSGVARCEAAVRRRVAGCDWVAPTLAAPPEECRGVVVGLVAEGKSCRSSLECEGALHCEGQGAASPGVCRAPQPISAACGVGVDPLATYLSERHLETKKPSCAEQCSLVTHRCEARPELGAACRASVQCTPEQRCRDGRCELRDPGTEGTLCHDSSCAAGHRCVSGRCSARSLPGEACRNDLDCAEGGCTRSPDGAQRCGMKCTSALGSLAAAATEKPLPLRPSK